MGKSLGISAIKTPVFCLAPFFSFLPLCVSSPDQGGHNALVMGMLEFHQVREGRDALETPYLPT